MLFSMSCPLLMVYMIQLSRATTANRNSVVGYSMRIVHVILK